MKQVIITAYAIEQVLSYQLERIRRRGMLVDFALFADIDYSSVS